MNNCLIIHGKPSKASYYSDVSSLSNRHWFPWVQHRLLLEDVLTQTLEMPTPYAPVYSDWERLLGIFPIDKSYSLVGHSLGGGFLLRYLSEHKFSIDKLVLVAPWLDPIVGKTGDFFAFEHDPELLSRIGSLHVLYSTDDHASGIAESVEIIKGWYPKLIYHEFTDKGHFRKKEMNSIEFPELLEIIVGS